MKVPPSLVPQYSTSRGPHQSIMARLVVGEIGAAPCRTNDNGEGSNARRVVSGSRSRRTNIVGTRWVCAIARSPMSCNTEAASNSRHHHDRSAVDQVVERVAAHRRVIVRSCQQMRAAPVEMHRVAEPREQVEVSADRRGQHTFDSLWPSGGATRVVHPTTGCTAQVEWGVARVSRSTVELVADTDHRRLRARARHREVIGISEYGLHAGIVEDVARLRPR